MNETLLEFKPEGVPGTVIWPALPRSNIGRHLQDGHDCLLLETGEPEELARRIQECLDDPALSERLGAGARRFAEANFSWSRNAETLLRFYESVLG